MFLKEVTLQGFKSYAERNVVGPFDSHFNALTGLNGSGKSNVLDGICFALGLTTLSHVRANSLQDLVYQQGQSGVRSAVVSLTFDNCDKSRSPREYTDCDEIHVTREIVIQGKNKLRINGRNADHNKVEALFQSVGMNINNPHFVIMQGKITQVLNMKPLRILAMLEEAAGTSVYDKRKGSAKQKLADNEAKVDELDKVTRNDLLPKMQIQREEKAQYKEYSVLVAKCESLQRFCIAYEFSNCQSIIKQCSDGNTGVHQEVADLDNQFNSLQSELTATTSELDNVAREKDKKGGRALKKAEDSLHNLEKRLVEEQTNLANCMELKEGHEVEKLQIQSDLEELSEEVYNARVATARKKDEELQQAVEELKHVIRAAECDLASSKDGIPRDEEGRTLPERLDLARTQETAAKGDADAINVRVSALEKQLSSLKQSLEPRLLEAREQEGSLLSTRHKIQHLESELKALAVDPSAVSHLEERIAKQEEVIRQSRATFEDVCQSSGLEVPFQDPYPGFNRKESVKGVLARLFTVKDPQHTLALEVAMGGRLRNLVVDTAQNASQILKNGKLRRRTTIAPLDQIQAKSVDKHARDAVRRAAGDDAIPAIDLISYAPEVSRAMEYACGTTFICKDSSLGSRLSRDLKGLRFVTLAGQDFSTDGTFSDGFRDPKASILNRAEQIQGMEAELMSQLGELSQAQEQLQSMAPRAKEHDKLSKELDAELHKLSLHEKHYQTSSIQQDVQLCSQLESDLESARSTQQSAYSKVEKLLRLQQELQQQIAMLGTSQHVFVQETQLKLQANKERLAAIEPEAMEARMAYKAISAEGCGAEREREKIKKKMLAAEEQWKGLIFEVESHQKAIRDLEAQLKEQKAIVQEKQQGLVNCNKQSNILMEKKQELEASLSQMNIKKQEVQSRLSEVMREEEKCLRRKEQLLKDHPWIAAQQDAFGVAGTNFDWVNNDPKKQIKEFENVKKRIEELKPRINKNIEVEYDATKEEMYMLEKRRLQLQGDKKKILKMMHKLDGQKAHRIEETWTKVKDKLGEIFRTLLPGADATLQPLTGHSILDGLEIKVALGGKWKESLTDLSGGQRSLCALALILALLVFSPAPIYILDEVDAALDLSHTQNMGVMIKKFFPQSQFLIVSLKEGMFSNANVIFRTKLVHGKSCITRSVGYK